MNGTLASEACNCVLDLITGYSSGAAQRALVLAIRRPER